MAKPRTVRLNIVKLRSIIEQNKDNPKFNPNIFTEVPIQKDEDTGEVENYVDDIITQFELSGPANEKDKEQFIKDWSRNNGITIQYNGKEHYIHESDVDKEILIKNPIKALKDAIENKGIEITEGQVDRIVQHFSQRSIEGMDVLITKNIGMGKEANPRLLNIEIDDAGIMKMDFYSSVGCIVLDDRGSPKVDSDHRATTEFVSSINFEAKIDKNGVFTECALISQYQNPELSSFPKLMANSLFTSCFKEIETDRDIATDNPNNIAKLLGLVDFKKNREKYEELLDTGVALSKFTGIQIGAEYILQETLFNPYFNKDKKKFILRQILEMDNGKDLLKRSLFNSNSKFSEDHQESTLEQVLDVISNGKELSEQILNDNTDLLEKSLFNSNSKFSEDQKKFVSTKILKMDNVTDFLQKTLFDSKFQKDKSFILEEVLNLDNGKDLVEEALTHSIVKYLDEEFKKNRNVKLTKEQKSRIAIGLEKIIKPLKHLGNNIEEKHDIAELVDGLDARKLVSLTARESNDVKTGFYGKVKKFCRRVVDSLFRSRQELGIVDNKQILDSFKKYVSNNGTPEDHFVPRNVGKGDLTH